MKARKFFAAVMPVAAIVWNFGLMPSLAADSGVSKTAPDLKAVRALIKAKKFAPARDTLLTLSYSHEHADVYNLLGFSQRKLGDYENGLKNYLKALELDPNHKGAHEYLGQLYVETGKLDKAREHLVILERLCPRGCEERADLMKAITIGEKKK